MFAAIILGIMTGTLLGLLGGGGSIVAVPILVYALGLETKSAVSTSLVTVGAASLLAAASHYWRHYVLLRTGLVFGLAGCLGSYLGAQLGKLISDQVQLVLFAVVMGLVAILMLRKKSPAERVETSKNRSYCSDLRERLSLLNRVQRSSAKWFRRSHQCSWRYCWLGERRISSRN